MGKQQEELIHDLRNSATVIKAAAAEMSDGLEDLAPEVLRQLSTMIQQRSERLLHQLDHLTGEETG
jgi:signal transduction histidine kinase